MIEIRGDVTNGKPAIAKISSFMVFSSDDDGTYALGITGEKVYGSLEALAVNEDVIQFDELEDAISEASSLL